MLHVPRRLPFITCILAVISAGVVIGVIHLNQNRIRGAIEEDYQILETSTSTVQVAPEEVTALDACATNGRQKVERCGEDFYKTYTLAHGIENGMAHLVAAMRDHHELIPGCHYFAHGIGEAAFIIADRNPMIAYGQLSDASSLKNIATCGNGYYHGVVKAYSETLGDTFPHRVSLLGDACRTIAKDTRLNCYHGIGHVSFLTRHDVSQTVRDCSVATSDPYELFFCNSGAFMESTRWARIEASSTDVQLLPARVCDALPLTAHAACYTEYSIFFEERSGDNIDWISSIGHCKSIADATNRMACVKLFAIRSVRIGHYRDIGALCSNVATNSEQSACVTFAAERLAESVAGGRKPPLFDKVVQDVCQVLTGPVSVNECIRKAIDPYQVLLYSAPDGLDVD